MLSDRGVEPPEWVNEARTLTPFGALLRYAGVDFTHPFDRVAMISLVERVVAWSAEEVDAIGSR